jgi:hypothetical protein
MGQDEDKDTWAALVDGEWVVKPDLRGSGLKVMRNFCCSSKLFVGDGFIDLSADQKLFVGDGFIDPRADQKRIIKEISFLSQKATQG